MFEPLNKAKLRMTKIVEALYHAAVKWVAKQPKAYYVFTHEGDKLFDIGDLDIPTVVPLEDILTPKEGDRVRVLWAEEGWIIGQTGVIEGEFIVMQGFSVPHKHKVLEIL